MTAFLELLSLASTGILFGGMLFFPTIVAPTVFRSLQEEDAGRFLRALFPAYYGFIILLSAIALIGVYSAPILATGFALTLVSTLAVRQLLVPAINQWRDQDLAGVETSANKFAIGHRISVIINMAQLLFVAYAYYALATG